MSGGEYDYVYSKLEDFVEKYKDNLDLFENNEGYDEVKQYHRDFCTLIEVIIPALKAIEWEHSGDSYGFYTEFMSMVRNISALNLNSYIKPKIPTIPRVIKSKYDNC